MVSKKQAVLSPMRRLGNVEMENVSLGSSGTGEHLLLAVSVDDVIGQEF